jgi:hypothetical protein
MKTLIKILIIAISFIFNACSYSDDIELSRSVFINDPTNPGLPAYSEWGYNTFGAYIDRKVFVSENYELPTKIIVNGDTLKMQFRGRMNNLPTTLRFWFIGYNPLSFKDLTSFNDKKIDLKSDNCIITYTENNVTKTLRIIEGEMHFVKAQNLYIDKELTRTILSGKFQFKTFFDNEPIAITNGRFDFGIGYENFYNF